MSMNIYDMEVNSRIENLVAFKKVYADSLRAISCCLEKFFPSMSVKDIQEFMYSFFPFLFGVYPYTSHTQKQLEAMELANVNYTNYTIYELTKSFIIKMLKPFEK